MNEILYSDKQGSVKISNDVVSTISEIAAKEIAGVVSMSGGLTNSITEMLGKKTAYKGVKVEVEESNAAINVSLVVELGSDIPKLATEVQENIKRSVETMTGLTVSEVNVNVQGVVQAKEAKEVVSQ